MDTEGEKPSIFKFKSSADGIKLTNEFSVFKVSGYSAEAYYCNSCHVVIALVIINWLFDKIKKKK